MKRITKKQRGEWALDWFNGNACCPCCKGENLDSDDTAGDGGLSTEWECLDCHAKWDVFYEEVSITMRDADGDLDVKASEDRNYLNATLRALLLDALWCLDNGRPALISQSHGSRWDRVRARLAKLTEQT